MAVETCPDCTTRFAVGLLRCPHCQAPAPRFADRMKEEDDMPRITVEGGPSNPDALPGEVGYIAPPEESDEAPADAEESASEAEAPAEDDYEDWTVEQLKEQLGERGLPKTGNKGELVARLREDDHTDAAPETRVHAEPATGSGEAGNLS